MKANHEEPTPAAPAGEQVSSESGAGGRLLRSEPEREQRAWLPWIVAGAVVLGVLAVVLFAGGRKSAPVADTPDAYAGHMHLSGIQMSEAGSFSGAKVTYIDGKITNGGSATVTGVTVRVSFPNSIAEPPQQQTLPLMLIRTREPYVDTEPVSADPLTPGATRDFRLIFDSITPNWNQQMPTITVVQAARK